MINSIKVDPNAEWDKRVECLNVINKNIHVLGEDVENFRGLEKRKIGRKLIRKLVKTLEKLDVLVDSRGR